jgi:hypothetical protein
MALVSDGASVGSQMATEQLPVGWWWSGLPGVDAAGTYEFISPDRLPRLDLNSLRTWDWVPEVDAPQPWSISDLDDADDFLRATATAGITVPASFRSFISAPRLRWAIRSGTGCWWSLGLGRGTMVRAEIAHGLGMGADVVDELSALRSCTAFVPVLGRHVVRFLTDQQDCLYWFLVLGGADDPVVVSDVDITAEVAETTDRIWKVAATFEEFMYRFWIENEIAIRDDEQVPLTPDQAAYLAAALRLART